LIVVTIRAVTQTTSLGRYQVIRPLAEGGMADVLLARTRGIEGFERHVVIKRIHAEQARDHRYVTMFLDEARLAASLHHHNIVQVNDVGEEDNEYFFAMEYVHGEDVRAVLNTVTRKNERVPLEHIITIVTATAAGLHHAHEQRKPDRTPLGIVHRDVSPANILIGYDGGVKVADFGIAKAAHRNDATNSGLLKGKVAYMSPEQCNSEPVDRRSDVFSLGIVLYELVTARPLFQCENDFLSMSAIVHGRITPPSQHAPGLPAELEAIMMKALATAREDRYATADEMRLALEAFANNSGLRTSTTALADYMKLQFGERPEPWLARDDADDPEIEITGSTQPILATVLGHKPIAVSAPPKRRRIWIAGALAVVAVCGVSLVVVAQGDKPVAGERRADDNRSAAPAVMPAPTPAPAARHDVAPLPKQPELAVDPAPETVPTAAPQKKQRKAKPKAEQTPATNKHWDPHALFPQ
jgi:serine/threonine protein kinase